MGNFVVKERMVRDTRRGGFTLMELMVYIAILGIVVIVAGQAFSNSAKSRVRTQSMLKATEVAENVATLFKTDVAQTGAKSSMETHMTDGGNDVFDVYDSVYMHPDEGDDQNLASYDIIDEGGFSNLKVRRVRYDDLGHYQAVEEINWFVQDGILKRSCLTIDGSADENCAPKGAAGTDLGSFTVEIASDVDSFVVMPAIPDNTEANLQMFPLASASGEIMMVSRMGVGGMLPVDVGAPGTSIDLTGFAPNFDEENDDVPSIKKINEVYVFEKSDPSESWKSLCENSVNNFSFSPGEVYELAFGVSIPTNETEKAKMFVPGKDHMAVGFRSTDGDKISQIPDFMFYPPAISEANSVRRTMRFSVADSVKNACIAFTFAAFSPLMRDATISISDVRLKKIAGASHTFGPAASVNLADRKNVKALRLRLQIKRNGEAGDVTLVVPTPSNGPTD